MSYEIIKKIFVDSRIVYINSATSNSSPIIFRTWTSPYLSGILRDSGEKALDLAIMREYEKGNMKEGNNKYTDALKRLLDMPEYALYNWRKEIKSADDPVWAYRKNTGVIDALLMKALDKKACKKQTASIFEKEIEG